MKKFAVLVCMVLAVAASAQKVTVNLANASRSEKVWVSIPDLWDGEYAVIKAGPTPVILERSSIDINKVYDVTIRFSECGGYSEKTTTKIGKEITFKDLRGPCKEDNQKGSVIKRECNCEDDSTFAVITNSSASEFKVRDAGPFHGLTLAPGQTSLKCKVGLGDFNLTLATFRDTSDRKVIIQSVVTRFITKVPSCIFVLVIKDEDLSTNENLVEKQKLIFFNNTDRSISAVDPIFKGINLASGKKAKRSDRKEVTDGFIPATIEFLDNSGVRRRVNIYKHIVKGDEYYEIDQADLKLPEDKKSQTNTLPSSHRRR